MGAMPWLVAMKLDLTVEASNTPKPWAPRHGTGSHINVDALDTWLAGWCMLLRSEGLDQRHTGEHWVTRGTLRGRRQC